MKQFKINISNEMMTIIRSHNTGEFQNDGQQQPNGTWDLFISKTLFERVCDNMLPNETVDEFLMRAFAAISTKN